MAKYVVVEPHADDAFLSLGGHIERWVKAGDEVLIVTLIPVKKTSLRDAEAYAKAVGASWEGYDCGRLMKSVPWLHKKFDGQVILPLAIEHPDHWAVRMAFERGPKPWYYVDAPYYMAQKNWDLTNELLIGKSVVSVLKPSARKWRHVPLFKSQSKFFYFNSKEKLAQMTEMIVCE